jgi:hypothetical protein
MGIVCQQSKDDPQFCLHNILVKDKHCLDYMVMGHCHNLKCTFHHTTGAKPDKAWVPNFMAKVLPVLAHRWLKPLRYEQQRRRQTQDNAAAEAKAGRPGSPQCQSIGQPLCPLSQQENLPPIGSSR